MSEEKAICAFCNADIPINQDKQELARHYRVWPRDDGLNSHLHPISEVCFGSYCPVPKTYPELSSEEQADLRFWAKEREERKKILDIYDAQDNYSIEAVLKLTNDLAATSGDRCPHDRDIWGSCNACFDLEKRS